MSWLLTKTSVRTVLLFFLSAKNSKIHLFPLKFSLPGKNLEKPPIPLPLTCKFLSRAKICKTLQPANYFFLLGKNLPKNHKPPDFSQVKICKTELGGSKKAPFKYCKWLVTQVANAGSAFKLT